MKQRHHRKARQRAMKPSICRRAWLARANAYGRALFKDLYCSRPPVRTLRSVSADAADAFAYMAAVMKEVRGASGVMDFDVGMTVDNRTAKEVELYRADADKRLRNLAIYGTSHPEFYQQEWQPRERTKLELAAMEIAQQAELFDRALPYYVLKHGFEAIPADAGARHLSDRNFKGLITAASERLGVARSEVVRAERDYSRSPEFAQWLRENPPERRYQ